MIFFILACSFSDQDRDGVADAVDCRPQDASSYPGADELCDDLDNDCDGDIDEDPAGGTAAWRDADGDGHGSADQPESFCTVPEGFSTTDDDCNDSSAISHPGASEVCDALDNDCDDEIDEDPTDPPTFYADADGDGYGNASDGSAEGCSAPDGYASADGDCDESDSTIHPATLWYPDFDSDGFGADDGEWIGCEQPEGYLLSSGDCDDGDATISPDAEEVCDGRDTDCDGGQDADDSDVDGDGEAPCEGDCDDGDDGVYSAAAEVCDGMDNNCDGETDGSEVCLYSLIQADVALTGSSYDNVGLAMTVNGDIDGDGYTDILSGDYINPTLYYYWDADGVVDAWYGPFDVPSLDTDAISGTEEDTYLGWDLTCGDLDGDGYDDLLIGAIGVNAQLYDESGVTYLFYGPLTAGLKDTTIADASIYGDADDVHLGWSLETGDVDGDGVIEAIIGAPYGTRSVGRLLIIGPEAGEQTIGEVGVTISGSGIDAYVGLSALAGDVNGDGIDDLIYGDNVAGQSFILHGPITADADASSADAILPVLGQAGAVGDLDGDGYDDVVLGGAGYHASNVFSEGVVSYGYYAPSGILSSGDEAFVLSVTSSMTIGDISGDGIDDLLTGYTDHTAFGVPNAGVGYLLYGPISGQHSPDTSDLLLYGVEEAEYVFAESLGIGAGSAVGMADFDADGALDIAIGAPDTGSNYSGGIYLFLNSSLYP